MADQLLTVREVAAACRANEDTVRYWIRAGRLPAVRIGGRRLFIAASDLEAIVSTPYAGHK